jgi:hypothetical protein
MIATPPADRRQVPYRFCSCPENSNEDVIRIDSHIPLLFGSEQSGDSGVLSTPASGTAPVEVLSALCYRDSVGDFAQCDFLRIGSRLHSDGAYWELVEEIAIVLRG